MATKNTRDNSYYSLTKAFRFSSIIVLIVPLLLIIYIIVKAFVKNIPEWVSTAAYVIVIIEAVFALLWIVLNIILFVLAGNMRGIKSPLGIRIGLLIALILVLSGTIVYSLMAFEVIKDLNDTATIVLAIVLPLLEMAGYITGAILSKKIQKALRN